MCNTWPTERAVSMVVGCLCLIDVTCFQACGTEGKRARDPSIGVRSERCELGSNVNSQATVPVLDERNETKYGSS